MIADFLYTSILDSCRKYPKDIEKILKKYQKIVPYVFDLGGVLINLNVQRCFQAFEKLMGEEGAAADFHVLLNAFYANLVNGKAQHAIELLRMHCSTLDEKQRGDFPIQLANAMQEDARLLELYAIGKAEKTIILSQLAFFTL